MSEFIHVEKFNKVLLLQITDEKTLNCLNNDILEEMVGILHSFNRHPEYRALVLTGTGRSFCTGADLKAFMGLNQEECIDYCVNYEEDIFHILSSSRISVHQSMDSDGFLAGEAFIAWLHLLGRIEQKRFCF